jgi:DDE superfamily endonuclease
MRPIAPVQHRYEWRYLVAFVHPASGRTVFHLASSVSIPLFEVELAAFAQAVGASARKQIVLVLDRAGWHSTQRLRVPDHVHLLFLPPYSPELQPVEHLWQLTNTVLYGPGEPPFPFHRRPRGGPSRPLCRVASPS